MTIKVCDGKYEIKPNSRCWALYITREWGVDRSVHKNLRDVCSEILDSEVRDNKDYEDILELKARIDELERQLTVEIGSNRLLALEEEDFGQC